MEDNNPYLVDSESPSTRSAEALRRLEARAQQVIAARQDQFSRLESQLTEQLDEIAAILDQQRADEALSATRADVAPAEFEALQQQLAAATAELAAERAEQEAHQESQEAERARLAAELAGLRDKLVAAEQFAAERGLADESGRNALAQERDELQQKFDLALKDMQRLRERVAELEQELAQRPAGDQGEPSELAALRAERDALAERLEAISRQPNAPPDAAASQELADLQRRFELAVEDVRELKTKNAQLETQLSAARKRAPGHAGQADGGNMDWESQKRRLLESLEDDGEAPDEERTEQRTSIANTIEITDAVVAEKDALIESLKEQLATAAGSAAATAAQDHEAATSALLDGDEIIQQHRGRIAQLEQEMTSKLREAELELSVERARIGRQKVELEQLRVDLEAQKNALGSGGTSSPGAPKRRWLSKLGLGNEEGG
jgi:chromosome segregation ATPase